MRAGEQATRRPGGRCRQAGFTLIELMIAVAVVAILASIAYPSYTRYVERSKRTDAHAGLMDAAQVLERCYTVYSSYNNGSCVLSDGDTRPSPDQHYTISVASTDTSFTVTATFSGSGGDGCPNPLTLNNLGVRGPNDDCW
ncbi:type IV pilin protein [Halomonas salifodinae]|uniref:type IV pilin protein n=1 Tax=Halomonas salifodinae TaxID=438745 RepID=UPI0033A5518F